MPGRRATLRTWTLPAVLAAVAGVVLYWFPLFRIVRLDEAKREQADRTFQPGRFARELWENRLPAALDGAVDAATLLRAVREDSGAAKASYATTLGIGSVYCYFLRGKGYVLAVEEDSVGLALGEGGTEPDLKIATGMIFGNAVRDGIRLIDVSRFPNSRDFNRISDEINRIVESDVLPPFRHRVAPGDVVTFAGCAEIIDERTDLNPITIVPILLEID